VAVLFSRFGPYHHARLKAAGARLQVTGVEFSNVDTTYAWDLVEGADGFNRMTLFSGAAVNELPASRIFSRVGQVLDQLRPQVVAIPGWYDRCSLAALRWCGSHGVPAVVMSETTAWDVERKWLKEALKRRLIKLCAAGLVGGRAHADYLEQLGIERNKIFFGYDAVDNDYFSRKAGEVRGQGSEVRNKYGLPENFFLASARFVEKKNLSRLLQAFARYRALAGRSEIGDRRSESVGENVEIRNQKSEIWDLVLLGDGPLRSSIFDLRSSLGLDDHVLLPGFKQYGELPAYYGLAKVFIHASTTEQWGLVVNEAMASGLPILVSNRCGCAMDLVQEGRNGFSFDPYNIEVLAQLMLQISAFDFPLSGFGTASQQIAEAWGVSAFAEGMSGAVAQALRNPVSNFSLVDNICISSLIHGFRGSPVDGMEARKSDPETRHFQSDDTKFLVFQYRGRDVLAVPQRSKAVWLEGVKKYQPFTPKRQLYRTLLSSAIRFGCARLVSSSRAGPVDKDSGFDFKSWQTELERRLGRPITHAIFTWPSEPARRRLYVHLLDANLHAFAFVKLALRNDDHAKLVTEAEALRAMSKLPFQKIRVPKLMSFDRFGEASYLVIEPLPAQARPLLLKQDWDSSTLTAEFCGPRSRISGAEIMKQSWWSGYTNALQPEHQAFHQELIRLLPLGTEVCRVHGDLGLSNMVTDGSSIWLFDWESSHATAPALADAVGFFMSFTVGRIPRDPTAHLARFQDRFLPDNSEQQRLAVMLAVGFRHSCGIRDAGRLMQAWPIHSD
jgi:glycosyltransferase involved in cell wall biosynthesis